MSEYLCMCISVQKICANTQSGSYMSLMYTELKKLNFPSHCMLGSGFRLHIHRSTSAHTDPTLLSPLPQLSLSLPGCSAGWLTSRAAGLGGGCPVCQSISRLSAQRRGRQSVSQAVWWRAEGLMRVSERRSPTFPRRLAAGRACGGGFASFSRPLRFLRSSGSYSFPARNQPSPATAGGGGMKRGGRGRGVWLRNEPRAWYSKPWA